MLAVMVTVFSQRDTAVTIASDTSLKQNVLFCKVSSLYKYCLQFVQVYLNIETKNWFERIVQTSYSFV